MFCKVKKRKDINPALCDGTILLDSIGDGKIKVIRNYPFEWKGIKYDEDELVGMIYKVEKGSLTRK